MERITFDGDFCVISMCQEPHPCKYYDTGCSQKQVWDRLKAYEGTGLTPEQCADLWKIQDNQVEQCTQCEHLMANRWIPVSERLPSLDTFCESDFVLAATCTGDIVIVNRDNGHWCTMNTDLYPYERLISHWMPLPEQPEVG